MSDYLDNILCGEGVTGSERYTSLPVKQESAIPTIKQLPSPMSGPITVMAPGGKPVIVEDPVRFRKDIQTMVTAQMLKGLPNEEQIDKIKKEGSMIEIATVMQLVKAACGDLDSFKYMMDRVLGKPVNQTNTVSMVVSYENMLDELDPNEVIEPKKVFCEEV